MRAHRLFIIAPSLARLIRQERGGEHVREGYFPDQPDRSTYVQIEETRSSLILEAGADEASEERTDLPPAHAQALLTVSQGQVECLRTPSQSAQARSRPFISSHPLPSIWWQWPAPPRRARICVRAPSGAPKVSRT